MAKRAVYIYLLSALLLLSTGRLIACAVYPPAEESSTAWGGGPLDTIEQFLPCQEYITLDSTYLLVRAQDGCDSLRINYVTELADCVACGDQCIYITGSTSISGGETEGAEVIVTYRLNGDTLSSGRGDWTGEVDQLACFPITDSLQILTVEALVPNGASGTATASAWIVRNPGVATDTTYVSTASCRPEDVGIQIDTLRGRGGCDSLVIREVSLYPLPEVFLFNQTACAGDTVQLFADGTVEGAYRWNTGQSGEVLTVSTTGTYSVTLTDDNGCSAAASAEVQLSQIEISLSPTIFGPLWLSEAPLQVWQGAAVELEATVTGTSLDYDILWNGGPEVGDTIFNLVAQQDDTVTVAVIDTYGCVARAELPLQVQAGQIFVPNAFSPNDDQINDEFGVYTSPNVEELRLQLFHRGGGMVLDQSPQAIPSGEQALYWPIWNGLLRGKPLDPQTLTWQLRYRLYRGEWRTLAGELILVR
jgi:hypothetical protein